MKFGEQEGKSINENIVTLEAKGEGKAEAKVPLFSVLPNHVAIVMDGNGRWAQNKGLDRVQGHKEGAKNALKIMEHCGKLGIRYLTLYTFSSENWNRPKKEVKAIMSLLHEYLISRYDELIKNEVSLSTIGETKRLPFAVQKALKNVKEKTKSFNKMHVTLALSYGSRAEIVRAVKKVVRDVQSGVLSQDAIEEDLISQYLDTSGTPDPDLWIRTSGEMRLSNCLLWQLSYSELYITKKTWPDFGSADLDDALQEFALRNRRYGRIDS